MHLILSLGVCLSRSLCGISVFLPLLVKMSPFDFFNLHDTLSSVSMCLYISSYLNKYCFVVVIIVAYTKQVHPFEFATGEYLHLLCIAVIPCHVVTVALFIAIGGLAASLNHSRHAVKLPFKIFNVKYHDHHHVVPNKNYSQYVSVCVCCWYWRRTVAFFHLFSS